MNKTQILILEQILQGIDTRQSLKKFLPVNDASYIDRNLKALETAGYIVIDNKTLKMADTAKSILLRDIYDDFNISLILGESNETIFAHLKNPQTATSLEHSTGLAPVTVYRSLRDLQSIGAVVERSNIFKVNTRHEKLILFASILLAESKKTDDVGVETLYQDELRTLQRVTKGKMSDGQLTGFSLYSAYGIKYDTVYDYYIQQKMPLELEDVLVHSIRSAYMKKNKIEITMCMIFYLKNKARLDAMEIRKIAHKFGVSDVWVDMEGYIRNNPLKNEYLFLPKNEFIEKADLYDIPTDAYNLPDAYPDLFEDIGSVLEKKVTVYLIGGENMRIKGLKSKTKDCDVLVKDKNAYDVFTEALVEMGYDSNEVKDFSKEDKNIHPSMILEHKNRSRVDVFTQKIRKEIFLSKKMIERAEFQTFKNLRLGMLANEDVFLLKSVTSRDGDIQDMAALVMGRRLDDKMQKYDFNWDIVWNEILLQEKDNYKSFSYTILDSLEFLSDRIDIKPPFWNALLRRVLDNEIEKLLRERPRTLKFIIDYLKGEKLSEQFIRNRVNSMIRKNLLKKITKNNKVIVQMVKPTVFPQHIMLITTQNIEEYLQWRFPIRMQPATIIHEDLTKDLIDQGFENIGQLDKSIIKGLDALRNYDTTLNPDLHSVNAARICLDLP